LGRARFYIMLYLLAYIATIPAANWMIGHVGTVCLADGPCLIPVWPGITAPSGVLMAGAALVLRDMVQFRLGKRWGLTAIAIGAGLSALVAPPALVIASTIAFLLSELADFVVYTPLAARRLVTAVILSGIVGTVIDSVVFLGLAFGSLAHLEGQIIGKAWMVLFAAPLIKLLRTRREHKPV